MTDTNTTTATYTAQVTEKGEGTVSAMILLGSQELGEVLLVTLAGDVPDTWGDTIDHWASDGVVEHLLGLRQEERREEIEAIVSAVRRAMR